VRRRFARGPASRAGKGAGQGTDGVSGASGVDGGKDRVFKHGLGHRRGEGGWNRFERIQTCPRPLEDVGQRGVGEDLSELGQPLGELPAAEFLGGIARPGLPCCAGGGQAHGVGDRGRGVEGRGTTVGEADHRFGIGAKTGSIESSHRIHESDWDSACGDVPGGRTILVQRDRELERVCRRVEGGRRGRLHPTAGRSRGQMEHSHSRSVEVEIAAIGGHRLHDAESELGLIGELARMNLFSAGLSTSLKTVDRAELRADLGSIHAAHGCTEGVADSHAEERAEELILCCVWHLTHPNPPASVCISLTPNRWNPRLPACDKGRQSGQEPRFDIAPNERGNARGDRPGVR
jgi:hypothetical protein